MPPPPPQAAVQSLLVAGGPLLEVSGEESSPGGNDAVDTAGDLTAPVSQVPDLGVQGVGVASGFSAGNGTAALSTTHQVALEVLMVLVPPVKPEKFTLETLGDAIVNLTRVVSGQSQHLQKKIQKQEVLLGHQQTAVEALKSSVAEHAVLIDSMRDFYFYYEDLSVIRVKLKALENTSRASNLRFVNFPKSSIVSPQEMFKRYPTEILQVSKEAVPPLLQIYYLPSAQKELSGPPQAIDTLNVSALLEDSRTENIVPATLLVSLALLPDRGTKHFLK